MNKLLFILVSIIFPFYAESQSKVPLSHTQTFAESDLNHANFFEKKKSLFGMDASTTMVPLYQYTSKAGVAHYKYQQHYKGLPIVGQVFFLDEKDGKVFRSRGNVSASLDIAIEPNLSKEKAHMEAKNMVRLQMLKKSKEMVTNTTMLPALDIKNEQLVIIPSHYPAKHSKYVLAYKIRVATPDKKVVQDVYLNANDGSFIFKNDVAKQHNVPAIAKTKYYGEQQIIVDSISPTSFKLIDKSRGQYVVVYSDKFGAGTVLTDTDNYWSFPDGNKSQIAFDAFYCSEKFYDFMANNFNWNGIDGNGSAIIAQVEDNTSDGLVNAFWNGESAYFGGGDCQHGPLTTLEVVGHEFMHGITEFTSQLDYFEESGAINEGMSDCFGKGLEKLYSPQDFSWEVGHSFLASSWAQPLRSMKDPKSSNCPAMYRGELWDDENDVHVNSSLLNYWFYMMVDGKSNVNELNISYNVSANDMQDVLQILWLCQTAYLGQSSNYNDLALATLQATEELYGANSTIYQAAVEAWKAVNLPFNSNVSIKDLAIEFENNFFLCETVHSPVIKIINNGNVTILNAVVRLNYNDKSVNITLPPNFYSQAELIINENQLKDTFEYGVFLLNCSIDFEDDYNGNNKDITFIQILSPDIYVEASSDKTSISQCTHQALPFKITNKSCIPTTLNYTHYVEIIDKLSNIPIGKKYLDAYFLFNGEIIYDNIDIDFSKLTNQNGDNEVIFRIVRDGIAYDWESVLSFIAGKVGLYENPLDNQGDVDAFNLYGEFSLANYQNQVWLKSNLNYFSSANTNCNNIDVESLYDTYHSYLDACFDISSIAQPALSFDAALFRSVFTTNEYSSYIKVATNNDTDYQLIKFIYDQVEGEIKNYIIPLPPYFEGNIQFDFYSENPDNGNGGDNDYQLIDNIKIIDLTATKDLPITESQDAFYPNPSNGLWQYQANLGKVEQLSCVDPLGKSYTLTMQDNEVNAQHLNPGLYFLRWKANGQYYVQKMVVMQ